MNETLVTIVGNAATDVRYSTTAAGVPLASFRLASTERRFDRQRGAWVDGETSFVTVWAWRWMAENVVSSVGKGDPLVVTGKLRVRDREQDGKRVVTVDIDAWALGHDLARGTSAFRRAVRARPELVEQQPSWERTAVGGEAMPTERVPAPV
ncbi:single-stranded DNA-binding protein [Streptomyces sp. NPDC092296]|uniref:single-stranded DNA-binding protein n=1 Tax=Streptomyces sp. NPDC092296 TaxID=3366012 RepID=UPI00380B1BA5